MKKKKLKKLLKAAQAALHAARPADDGRTLNDWLDKHEAELSFKGYKVPTIKNRLGNLKHVRRLWGERPIRALRPSEVTRALRTEFLPDRSSTAQRVLFELRDAYAEAIAADWADHNPASPVKTPKHRVKRARLALDTWQRMREVARAMSPSWVECMLLLALVTGQRRADLAKARFDDVITDHEGHQFLRVEQQKEAGKGYGAKVEIPLDLRMDALGITVAGVIERCRACGRPGPNLLRKIGGKGIQLSSLSARFHELIVSVLGTGAHKPFEWPCLHEVRSLSARTYIAQGMPPEVVQVLLGHKNIEMTELYNDDRGLTKDQWKRVPLPAGAVA